jgi:hypothetical protein
MKDQGLGVIGLIALALALTVLVIVGAPIAASRTTLELKDWLGFAGNILSALVTLIAAYIAWRAVQSQIGTQQDATLLVLINREEDRVDAQIPTLVDLCEMSESCISQALAFAVEARLCLSRDIPRMRALSGSASGLEIYLSANVPLLTEKVPAETRSHVGQIYANIRTFAVACTVANNELLKLISPQQHPSDGILDELVARCDDEFRQNLMQLEIYIRYAENILKTAQERIGVLRARSLTYRAEIERISASIRGN